MWLIAGVLFLYVFSALVALMWDELNNRIGIFYFGGSRTVPKSRKLYLAVCAYTFPILAITLLMERLTKAGRR